MAIHSVEHVREREGEYFVGNTRVTLYGAIGAWKNNGRTVEGIVDAYPSVTLADAYGAVAFYLDHEQEMDEYFAFLQREFERRRAESQAADPEFHAETRRRKEVLLAAGWPNLSWEEAQAALWGDTFNSSAEPTTHTDDGATNEAGSRQGAHA